jgi:CRP-like cAMP-binding protein
VRKNTKIELLKRVPLFSGCSKQELAEVASVADEIDVGAKRTLTTEGEPGREFVVIVEGTAEVRKRRRRLNMLGAGDFLGEIALVSGGPRTATVTTTTPARLLVISHHAFRSLMTSSPKIQTKVLEALAERLHADSL